MEAGKGKVNICLGSSDFILVLNIHVLCVFDGCIPFLHQLAFHLQLSIYQSRQVNIVSSFHSREITGRFLGLGLKFNLDSSQSNALLLNVSELGVLITELILQLSDLFLGGLQLGDVRSSSQKKNYS